MQEKKCKILVLQGVPASGKSTYAKSLDPKVWVRVNRDDIRRMMGGYMIESREKFIEQVEKEMVIKCIYNEKNVCIDDTNLNPKTIRMWKDIADEYHVDIEFMEFKDDDIDAIIERDKHREKPVGKKVILDFYKRYYPETYDKYFTDDRIMDTTHYDSLLDVVLCDLDGTLAIHCGRSPFDYSKIPTDKCDIRLKRLLKSLNCEVIFLSGREGTEECRKNTRKWLDDNGFATNKLFMRKEKDFRPDNIIKKELFEENIKGRYNLLAIFDDRDQVVEMWRELGLLCCQVYYGNF